MEEAYHIFDPESDADEFADEVGLRGSFGKWLEENSDVDEICEEFAAVLAGVMDQKDFVKRINRMADAAVRDGYAARRLGFIRREGRKGTVEVCTHPITQRHIVQFMITHLRECEREGCDMVGDARELIDQGREVLPALVEDGLWSNFERLMMVGMLDQLEAAVRDSTA